MNRTCYLPALLAVGQLTCGCSSLEKFDTKAGEAYCGSIQAPANASLGFNYWTNQGETLRLSLTLDSSQLQDRPGVVRSDDAAYGPCRPLPLFDSAPLRVVTAALGDKISSIRLGDDHEEDLLTFVDSTCSGSMLAVVSLIQNGDVELRLLRPAQDIDSPEQDRPRFGLFVLNKQKLDASDCDF